MEFANGAEGRAAVRELAEPDLPAVTRLLRSTRYSHLHVDWYTLADWLGRRGFWGLKDDRDLLAFLSVGADPLPAAWIRGMAVDQLLSPMEAIERLLASARSALRAEGASELAAMTIHDWPGAVLPALGFDIVTEVVTMIQLDDATPFLPPLEDVRLREATARDLPVLAAIEEAAFSPIWRYSARGLRRALAQCFSFDVATLGEQIVGYQCSTASQHGVHLARMTVAPTHQGVGVGSALLAHALAGYGRRGFSTISLNTQIDNVISQRLYRRFGFHLTEERVPVWSLPL